MTPFLFFRNRFQKTAITIINHLAHPKKSHYYLLIIR